MNPTNVSSTPDLEIDQQEPATSVASVCPTCSATNVTTRFCTNCGAEVSARLEPAPIGIAASVKAYLKAVAAIKAEYKPAVRPWFSFAWRAVFIAIPPFVLICSIVFLTTLITSAAFSRVAVEAHSLESSEAARLMEETQNRVLHNLGQLRLGAFALLVLFVSPLAFKSRSIQKAIAWQEDNQTVSLKNAALASWGYHWRFWLLMIPTAILIWLLAYKPIVLFGQMTKGEEDLVKRVAGNVTEVLILFAMALISIMPFLDKRFARRTATATPNKAPDVI